MTLNGHDVNSDGFSMFIYEGSIYFEGLESRGHCGCSGMIQSYFFSKHISFIFDIFKNDISIIGCVTYRQMKSKPSRKSIFREIGTIVCQSVVYR
jgi:hypothetical protein